MTVNPALHIAMHEIVANQLWANDPPEMWETVVRLLAAGYERHEVVHMLASVVSGEVFAALRNQTPHEIERLRAARPSFRGPGSGSVPLSPRNGT